MKTRLLLCLAAALTLALAWSPNARAEIFLFDAILTPDQEAPITPPPDSTKAFGRGFFFLSEDENFLAFLVTYSDLSTPLFNAHFHVGPPGVAGPVVRGMVPILEGPNFPGGPTSGTFTGVWSSQTDLAGMPLTPALVADLRAGNLYFNIHSTQFTGGEIRGQITPVPEPSLLALGGAGVVSAFLIVRRRRKLAA